MGEEIQVIEKKLPKRYVNIDLMEVISILLVIVYHGPLYSTDILANGTISEYGKYLFNTLLSPCTSLFFFANGYLLFNKELNLKKHIQKIIKLMLLTYIWAFIKVLILMHIKNQTLSIVQILKYVWHWEQGWTNSLWFLGSLICIYFFFPLLKHAFDTNKKIFYYFTIVTAILTFGNTFLNEFGTVFLTQIIHKAKTLKTYNFFNIFNPFRGIHGYTFVYFCVGGIMYQFKEKILLNIKPIKRNIIAILVMMICCTCLFGIGICYSTTDRKMWDVVWRGYDSIFTFINVICIFILSLNLKKDFKIIRIISCNTLGIYFIHEILIELTRSKIKSIAILCSIPSNIIYAMVILFASLAITLLMKKIPIVKKLVT
jgi:surface polysaccharide O-acyltransferase-like enzyme